MFPELRQWTEYLVALGRSEVTINKYRYAVLRFLSETPKDSLAEITEQDVVSFLASLGKRSHAKQLYVFAIRSFGQWGERSGVFPEDPTKHLHPRGPYQKAADAYTADEIVRLVDAANAHSELRGNAITVCYALGLRRAEVCGIRPEDIDWESRRVYILRAKGGKPRWIEMNELARGALLALQPWWKSTVLGDMHPQWFTMIVNAAAKESGLPPSRRRAHLLRASFATHALGNGAPISVVSRLLGHSNVAITSRYLAVSDEDRRRAVDSLSLPRRDELDARVVPLRGA